MTLVVARIHGARIAIAADTLLTEQQSALPFQNGSIKFCFLPVDICVAFCNSPDLAEREFERFIQTYPTGTGFAEVVSFFEESSSKTSNDYIVAFSRNPRLIAIRNGKRVSSLSHTAWIGDATAYSRFREYAARQRPRAEHTRAINAALFADEVQNSPASDLYSAIRNLIMDSTVPSVGGFVAVASNRDPGFRFSVYSDMLFDWPKGKDAEYSFELTDPVNLGGTGENAGYSVAQISPAYLGVNVVAFYFVKGRKLFLFHGVNNGLPNRCRPFDGIEPDAVCDTLNEAVGVDLKWLAIVASTPAHGSTSSVFADRGENRKGVQLPIFVDLNTFPRSSQSGPAGQ
jgi:hypothetical protein